MNKEEMEQLTKVVLTGEAGSIKVNPSEDFSLNTDLLKGTTLTTEDTQTVLNNLVDAKAQLDLIEEEEETIDTLLSEDSLVSVEGRELIIDNAYHVRLREYLRLKEEFDILDKEVKEDLKIALRYLNKKSYETDELAIVFKEATTRKSLDTTRFKNAYPDMYNDFLKESNVSESISVKLKED